MGSSKTNQIIPILESETWRANITNLMKHADALTKNNQSSWLCTKICIEHANHQNVLHEN